MKYRTFLSQFLTIFSKKKQNENRFLEVEPNNITTEIEESEPDLIMFIKSHVEMF